MGKARILFYRQAQSYGHKVIESHFNFGEKNPSAGNVKDKIRMSVEGGGQIQKID